MDLKNVNHYFVDIGETLARKISFSKSILSKQTLNNHPVPTLNSFDILPTDEQEIFTQIKALKENCTVGFDQITTKTINRYARIFTSPMTHICDLSITKGIFSSTFKTAVIKAIYKAGERDRFSNYRPISILPALCKVLERLTNLRLTKFLELNKLIFPAQYGFRTGRCTGDAVHELMNSVVAGLEAKKTCLALFFAPQKAFETVSIAHLLQK